MRTTQEAMVVASRSKRFWAFAIDQTLISLAILAIFIAVFATQTQQLANVFNTFFGDPLWAQAEQLPSDVFETKLKLLMSSEKVKTTVAALAHPLALATALSLVFEAVYYIIPTKLWGATPGKRWLHMKVHTMDNDTYPDWLSSSIRYFAFLGLGTFSGLLAVLDLFVNKSFVPSNIAVEVLSAILSQVIWILTIAAIVMICARPNRRGLHDILAGTIVHQEPQRY